MKIRTRIFMITFALLLPLAGIEALSGQANPMEPPVRADSLVHITLVMVSNGASSTFVRGRSPERRNLIMLDSATADAQSLSDAVFSLLIMEAVDPQGSRRHDDAVQRVSLSPAHPVYPWAEEALRRLRGMGEDTAPDAGGRRAIQIWMPRLRGRGERQ